MRKSSRKDVRVLIAISELDGTTSLRRPRNVSEGGRSIAILNTLGSTKSRWPVALPSTRLVVKVWSDSSTLFESETKPGTEVVRMLCKSSLSKVRSDDLLSMS